MEISEIFRKCIDAEIIERVTPGEDAYAYFELAANEEMDPAQVVKDLVSLEAVDLQADEKWIEEKTGYPVKRKVLVEGLLNPAVKPIKNRTDGTDGTDLWERFARETGTLEIPRTIMPQIQSGNRAAMVNKLRRHGVDYQKTEMKPADLKPTQAEYSPAKVDKAREFTGPQRALLVSSDNHVVDGHHQYLAALQDAPNTLIPVFKIKAPIMHVLGIILQMQSTGQEVTPMKNRTDGTDTTDATDFEKLFISSLADAVGVRSGVLRPIEDKIADLADRAADSGIDDARWLQFVADAAETFPELFDSADAEALAADLNAAMGTAALIGVRSQIQESRTKKDEL